MVLWRLVRFGFLVEVSAGWNITQRVVIHPQFTCCMLFLSTALKPPNQAQLSAEEVPPSVLLIELDIVEESSRELVKIKGFRELTSSGLPPVPAVLASLVLCGLKECFSFERT